MKWTPPGADLTKASMARVYDYWLGGEHNFPSDQDAARSLMAVDPRVPAMARANRAFLRREVRHMALEGGIRQFLDIGSGIPTQQNVHQIAQAAAPGARVVYVDQDDVAVEHSQLILDGNPGAAAIQADFRDPGAILGHPEVRRLIDFSQPVGLLLLAVLHLIPDRDDPGQILKTFRTSLALGSYLAISHACPDADPDRIAAFQAIYNDRVAGTAVGRTRQQIAGFFDGFTLVPPGLVWLAEWRPDSPGDVPPNPAEFPLLAGVGRLD
jgi:hypothetical protein